MIAFQIVYNPVKAFDRLKTVDVLYLGTFLMLVRWSTTAVTTVYNMYLQHSPMLLSPPFGVDEDVYRYYEIFWYGLYGLLIIVVITLVQYGVARFIYRAPDVTLRRIYGLVTMAFFAPWLPSVPGDYLLLLTVNAEPAFLVPFHISILVWECCLIGFGFMHMFQMSLSQSGFLGFVTGGIFVAMGALLIR